MADPKKLSEKDLPDHIRKELERRRQEEKNDR